MDYGHKIADENLQLLQEELTNLYKECFKQARKELKEVEEITKQYKDTMTKKERQELWKEKQRLISMLNRLTDDIQNVNQLAVEMINDNILNTYIENYNYAMYDMERVTGFNLDTRLYNREILKELAIKNDSKYFKIAIDNITDKNRIYKELKRNFIQAIVLGEAPEQIAKRVKRVTGKNLNSSMRIARTETTRLESKGRYDMYKKGENMGIKLKKKWISTVDSRTRHSHLYLQGEIVGLDEKFSNGLLRPADKGGRPEEVVNCRCTIVSVVQGVEPSANLKKLEEDIRNKTYEEFKRRKESGK